MDLSGKRTEKMGMLSETDIGLGMMCLLQETTTGWAED